MIRSLILLGATALSLIAGQTEFIFLVTGDGIRHQEVFTGADPALMIETAKKASGIDGKESLAELRKQFWAENPKERREKLMPYFWKTLSNEGMIFGNRALGSAVNCRNPHWFSYPGYAEILNGAPLPEITSNDGVFSPRETVLEKVRREFKLKPQEVAAFGSWSIFNWITMQKDGAIFCNAGYERMEPSFSNPQMDRWSALQYEIRSPWDTVRHDAITLGLALDYIKAHKPRVIYLALGETDDWAHDRRYDRTLQSVAYFDEALRRLWTLVQSMEPYRGKSALIVTTDHGRGRDEEKWTSHGADVPGADEAWLAVFGPDFPKEGEMKNTPPYSLSNVAATVWSLLGLPAEKYGYEIAPPIRELDRASRRN